MVKNVLLIMLLAVMLISVSGCSHIRGVQLRQNFGNTPMQIEKNIGRPRSIKKFTDSYGSYELWFYGGIGSKHPTHLFFTNSRLTSWEQHAEQSGISGMSISSLHVF